MDLQRAKRRISSIESQIAWLAAGVSLAVLPHVMRVPVWIPALYFSLLIWRLKTTSAQINQYRNSLLMQLGKFLLFFTIIISVLISYGTLVGQHAGVALLISLTSLKLMETRQPRDFYIATLIGLFLVLTNFLFTQSLGTALYTLLTVTVLMAALISFSDNGKELFVKKRMLSAGTILLQALPLMLVIFILFPRIPGPLWGLPKDAQSGMTGLSDEMSPGSISELTLSNKIAFRVKFAGPLPEQSILYWRGPVLSQTDGFKWVQDKPKRPMLSITPIGQGISYTVTLEPTNQNWLFGLEMVQQAPEDSLLTYDMQIRRKTPVRYISQYSLTSHTQYRFGMEDPDDVARALQLPNGYHSKTIALGASWREQGLSDEAITNRALAMFNEDEFYYTLSPPLLQKDTVDEFLFDTRKGFCEHYSAAFVILMRAAGIPSRVVTGYQGGEINQLDNYLVVRQRDAHAWAEVWLADRGWVRIDPTFAVSPLRISQGIENALPESFIEIPLGLQNNAVARKLWRQIRDSYEAINNVWNQWVLSYDRKSQRRLFNRMGLKDLDWSDLVIYLVAGISLVILVFTIWLFRQRNVETDQAKKIYDTFCGKMAKIGIMRYRSEGPNDFARRAARRRADLGQPISDITEQYISVRYAGNTETMDRLSESVNIFNPPKQTQT